MTEFKLKDEFIKLGQLLKAAGVANSGLEAKDIILSGEVFVNDVSEIRRGRKIYPGDIVVYNTQEIKVI